MKYDLKPVGNYLRINQLDWDEIHEQTLKNIDEFWGQWQELCAGKEFDSFDGPRQRALSVGIITCEDVSELKGNEWKVVFWDKPGTPENEKRNRCDVLKLATKEWLINNHYDAFSPISTWARLDENGWKEKGEMGWWGVSDATPESTKAHAKSGL